MNEYRHVGRGARYRVPRSDLRRLGIVVTSLLGMAAVGAGCDGASSAQSPQAPAVEATAAPTGHAATPHGDHTPHHGGAVLMHRDLHYEVVLPSTGGAQLYLTDEVRRDLPASVVSSVVIEIARTGTTPEAIELSMEPGGAFWTGAGRPVVDRKATVRVGFAYDRETVSVDLPYEAYFIAAAPPTAASGAR
jgi:hypothetical protein